MALKETILKNGNYLFKYRSYLPLLLVISGLSVFLYGKNDIVLWFGGCQYLFIGLCLLIGLCGVFVRFFAVGYSHNNTSGKNSTSGQKADEVNADGIYSLVRHPLYLGNFLIWFSLALYVSNIWFLLLFVLLYWLYYERIMLVEEEFMREKFGDTYLQWANSVPAIVPRLCGYRKPNRKFQYFKALYSEKNSLCALLFIFFVFNYFFRIKAGIYKPDYCLLILALTGFVYYLLLKIMKKKGNYKL